MDLPLAHPIAEGKIKGKYNVFIYREALAVLLDSSRVTYRGTTTIQSNILNCYDISFWKVEIEYSIMTSCYSLPIFVQ